MLDIMCKGISADFSERKRCRANGKEDLETEVDMGEKLKGIKKPVSKDERIYATERFSSMRKIESRLTKFMRVSGNYLSDVNAGNRHEEVVYYFQSPIF